LFFISGTSIRETMRHCALFPKNYLPFNALNGKAFALFFISVNMQTTVLRRFFPLPPKRQRFSGVIGQ
jgi:hypothetical protein